ncbi:enoyl-CoA hydratase/isomerase family protein [Marinobacter sp. X15-166B]|uniref:enoyl-CoA hydratase/isomerase family protein n=1 Tax=Marinobacter sp. X15-166B TaxID=1897620 RepID=UPI00085C99B6|nr:enoyl-CoA hydratase/isomerase family protein [Marinobacter sp. X15-166B]OEY66271.1 enoyl-CoA hydratase [Marinobacter sp. X15-166B]
MTDTCVRYRLDGQVARITLDRPERHNALTPALLGQLLSALAACRRANPRALILDAEGRSFSSGGDVSAFFDTPQRARQAYASEVVGRLNRVILALLDLPFPTVAAVHGLVTGGSVGLVLAADIVVVAEQASFAPWYTVVGFSPDGGWTGLMGQKIGASRALEMQLTNRTLTAQKAVDYGLAHYLVDNDQLPAKVANLCQTLLRKQPDSVRRTLSLNRPDLAITARQLDQEFRQFLEQIHSDEAHQGMAAFLKRAT